MRLPARGQRSKRPLWHPSNAGLDTVQLRLSSTHIRYSLYTCIIYIYIYIYTCTLYLFCLLGFFRGGLCFVDYRSSHGSCCTRVFIDLGVWEGEGEGRYMYMYVGREGKKMGREVGGREGVSE